MIRPGKAHLIKRPRFEIMRDIWIPTTAYHYKKSHAIAYAASIVIQLNLLVETTATAVGWVQAAKL